MILAADIFVAFAMKCGTRRKSYFEDSQLFRRFRRR